MKSDPVLNAGHLYGRDTTGRPPSVIPVVVVGVVVVVVVVVVMVVLVVVVVGVVCGLVDGVMGTQMKSLARQRPT